MLHNDAWQQRSGVSMPGFSGRATHCFRRSSIRRVHCASACKPVIIMVEPIMGENIGAACRAMKNFGLSELRLVAPKDGWPSTLAEANASNAQDVLQATRVYATLDDAITDLTYLYAATARPRFMNKEYVLSRQLYQDMPKTGRVGIMFGQEKSGLRNVDVARANKIVTIDANPEYPVLNLGQSVVLLAYELYSGAQEEAARNVAATTATAAGCAGRAEATIATEAASTGGQPFGSGADDRGTAGSSSRGNAEISGSSSRGDSDMGPSSGQLLRGASGLGLRPDLRNEQQLCTKGELESFLAALEHELEAAAFFESDDKKRAQVTTHLRNVFTRIPKLSRSEVAMLRGALSKLASTDRSSK